MTVSTERALLLHCRGEPLVAVMHVPSSPVGKLGIVIVVGGPQYRVGSHRQFVLTARFLADAGYPVLRFDVRGMGDSAAAQRSFEQVDEDIECAIDALLAELPGITDILLWGLCDGASAAAMYTRHDSRVTKLILVNPWVRGGGGNTDVILRHYYWQRILQRSFWSKLLTLKLNPFAAASELVDRTMQVTGNRNISTSANSGSFVQRMLDGLLRFHGEVLLLISGQDLTAREFLDCCRSDANWRRALARPTVSIVERPLANHTFSERLELDTMNVHSVQWLRRLDEATRRSSRSFDP